MTSLNEFAFLLEASRPLESDHVRELLFLEPLVVLVLVLQGGVGAVVQLDLPEGVGPAGKQRPETVVHLEVVAAVQTEGAEVFQLVARVKNDHVV